MVPTKKNSDCRQPSYDLSKKGLGSVFNFPFLRFFQVKDVIKIHRELHGDNDGENWEHKIILSLDGVSESKSSNISLDVYSIKFKGCREVYPIKIIRPINKYPVDQQGQFSYVLRDLLDNDLEIMFVVADNPKRSFLRFAMQHSAKFACEYCFSCGVSMNNFNEDNQSIVSKINMQRNEIQLQISTLAHPEDREQIETLNAIVKHLDEAEKVAKKNHKASNIVWPVTTFNGEKRTKEKILEIIEKIETEDDMLPSEKKGIKGRSPLLQIEYFDFVLHVPTEYMHVNSLGVVKRMLELCYNVGESRQRITKRPLSSPTLFNEIMKHIKVVKEFSRRARQLDLSVMKAQELRNVILFYFIIVRINLQSHDKEIKVWEMLAYMVRACVLPEDEFANVDENHIKICQKNFYMLFQQLYGVKNCSYSIHVVASHILLMRALGPLTESSAFRFESFYGELRQSFQPGSVSVVKQMIQNVLMKKKLSKHVCSETIYFSEKDTALECNSLIYLYKDNEYEIYKIQSIDNDLLVCHQMGNHSVNFPCSSMLNWDAVGVFRKGGLSSIDVIINKKDVAGKVLRVDKYLLTCPNNVLREK